MVSTAVIHTAINNVALNQLDTYIYGAIGDDNTTPTINDTTLSNETVRKALDTLVKNQGAGTYRFDLRIALTEGNGTTIREVGIFDANSGGNMALRNLLVNEVAKTSDKEVIISMQVTITTEDNS
jgi:hypothetical protein